MKIHFYKQCLDPLNVNVLLWINKLRWFFSRHSGSHYMSMHIFVDSLSFCYDGYTANQSKNMIFMLIYSLCLWWIMDIDLSNQLLLLFMWIDNIISYVVFLSLLILTFLLIVNFVIGGHAINANVFFLSMTMLPITYMF